MSKPARKGATFIGLLCLMACAPRAQPPAAVSRPTAMRVIITGLDAPWELATGPDGWLWITERKGKRVVRVQPDTGERRVALELPEVLQRWSGQDGLLGMALHARLSSGVGEDFVYLAYTYNVANDPARQTVRRAKIVRYRFDEQTQALVEPRVLLAGLPASSDHNSGRLHFGPDDTLYYSIGDQGRNQYDHRCEPNLAQRLPTAHEVSLQDWSAYEGKILRLALDGSIPADNPSIAGVRSHVYSYGHRNVQGLAFAPDGKLYASEHGPKTDDELNHIVAGKNYGWPHVAGYRDDRAYRYANWSAASPVPCRELEFADYDLPASVPQQDESSFQHPDFVPPITTLFTVSELVVPDSPECAGNVCWPTIAPSSLHVVQREGATTLLVPSLKDGSVYRVRLDAAGQRPVGPPERLAQTHNRYRDLALSRDQRTLYVITDSEPMTSGPSQTAPQQLDHKGALLAFPFSP